MMQTSPEKICFIVVKAREFDVPADVVEEDVGSNQADEDFREVLADCPDDSTYEEIKSFIDDLNEDNRPSSSRSSGSVAAITAPGRGTASWRRPERATKGRLRIICSARRCCRI